MRRWLFGLAIGAVLVAMPGVCAASNNFPPFIQQYLGAACAPQCTVCHNSLSGGTGTVTTRFGKTMMGFGLTLESTATLQHALDEEKAQHIDSDLDGDTDIDALIACKNPNVPNPPNASNAVDAGGDGASAPPAATPPAFNDPVPEYGCAIGSTLAGKGVWGAIAAAAVLVLRRRKSRARGSRTDVEVRRRSV
jgi:hypothetical protein